MDTEYILNKVREVLKNKNFEVCGSYLNIFHYSRSNYPLKDLDLTLIVSDNIYLYGRPGSDITLPLTDNAVDLLIGILNELNI